MNENDITTWSALENHCDARHNPITREMDSMSKDIRRLDARFWAMIIGTAMILATQVLGIIVSLALNGHLK